MSLNSQLIQGPNLTNTLIGVLNRLREEPVAMMADLESMFYQVKVPEEDEDLLHFLWWPNGNLNVPVEEFRMTVHLFGATSSPSCASYALRRTAEDRKDIAAPKVVETVLCNFYVDDCLKYLTTEQEAVDLIKNVRDLCAERVILPAKLLLRDMCKQVYGWDEEIEGKRANKWVEWLEDLKHLSDFKIQRCVKPDTFGNTTEAQMHHFSDASESAYGDTQKLDLRIVLMGYKYAGKSSSGNIILNREEFDLKRSAQCVKRQREVADRHITVIEAPGWWRNKPVEKSTELLKEEILLSVSLCPPGPHIVLLVIRVDYRFKEDDRKVLQGYVDLLGERVWSHTIVLFTHGDFLGDTSIEKHIESEGEDLQWLVEKCGNRYHLLNNKNRSDETQIKDLLEKIEETVRENNGCCFEMDRKILQEIEERKRAEKERAEERMKRMNKQREMIRSQMSDTQKLSDLRIVLMGYKEAGKSSSGNIILNRDEFDLKTSAQCVKRQREVADRHITVIEAPGWWINKPVDQSSELLKEEILLSVSLCPPGPHIVLLVIRMDDRFKEYERKVLQGYVDLLGKRVWSHTIVLFTHGDFLGDTTIEKHIESEGEDLQWLVEKCGNRYHLLNNKNKSDETQIKDLLEKIEETVTENNGRHFEINRKILQEIEDRRRAEKERAEERMKRMKKQREMIRLKMSDTQKLSDLRIVLMGYKRSGKSSSGNIILNRDEFDLKTTAQCVKRQREVADRHITVIEAPGWWINVPVEKSTELLKEELLLSVSLCPPGPHIVLLVICVDRRFKDVERKVLQGYVDLLGERVWSHTIVLFTHGDFLGDTTIEKHIESEGEDLQWLVEKCGNRYHLLNNKNRRDKTQIKDLLGKIEETVTENNSRYFKMDRKILQKVEERSRAEDERAEERTKRMKKQREMIRSQMGE
ncbi:GTPase IMAP family member 8 [Misgurnus anguillicaudatus]|uniref:GTPase IMAP family member 8 n=1 Tax=Misgurnus anguillicaudatus TaxID=75329 RepID=UPI003CCF0D1A